MAERLRRSQKISPEDAARLQAARSEFTGRPSKARLLEDGDYEGPMSLDEYLSWRKGAKDEPLSKQLQAAIASTGQSLHSIAQGSGVAPPILQRFVNGERGITLETAGKLATYLGLALLPRPHT